MIKYLMFHSKSAHYEITNFIVASECVYPHLGVNFIVLLHIIILRQDFTTHLSRDPHVNGYMIFSMAEDADTKAKRRRRIRESLAPPLNEIALRHVDSVQALNERQKEILAEVLQKKGLRHLVDCLAALKDQSVSIEDEAALIRWLELSKQSQRNARVALSETQESNSEDADCLARLLIKCYPDIPQSSAEALVASEVMSACLHVVVATRHALEDAKSDFVITALYALFEERLDALTQIINSNPAFVKAIQRSRPDWNIKN